MGRSASFALAVLFAVSAHAATIRRYSLDEVRDYSALIFMGHVTSSSTRPVLEGRAVTTDYVIEVDELIHGVAGATTTVSYMNAGRNGAPSLERGTEYLFFRSAEPNNTTIGWGQGLFRVEEVKWGDVSRKVFISYDGQALTLVDGHLARGPRAIVAGGRLITETASAAQSEPKTAGAAAGMNANGTRAVRMRASAATKTSTTATYATLDDVKRFVAARPVADH